MFEQKEECVRDVMFLTSLLLLNEASKYLVSIYCAVSCSVLTTTFI